MFPYLIEEKEHRKSSRSDSPKRYSAGDKHGDSCKINELQYPRKLDKRVESKPSNFLLHSIYKLQLQLRYLLCQVLQSHLTKKPTKTKKNIFMILNQKLLKR